MLSCYRPKRSFGQGNIFAPVCHSVHRGGLIFLGGVPPNFRGGCWFLQIFFWGGSSKFSGGCLFLGGYSKFSGGFLQIFRGGSSKFSGGGSPPAYGQRSAGTHPTGMHSCNIDVFTLLCEEYTEGYFYRSQTKLGARQCFYSRVSFCSPGWGGEGGVLHPGGGCLWGRDCIKGGLGRSPPTEIHGILRITVNRRAVRILLECFLVCIRK